MKLFKLGLIVGSVFITIGSGPDVLAAEDNRAQCKVSSCSSYKAGSYGCGYCAGCEAGGGTASILVTSEGHHQPQCAGAVLGPNGTFISLVAAKEMHRNIDLKLTPVVSKKTPTLDGRVGRDRIRSLARQPVRVACPKGTTPQPNGTCLKS